MVAFRGGSVTEVLEDRVSGFIVNDLDEAIAATSHIDTIDRRACRRSFERRFTAARMAADYERLYRRLSSGSADEGIVA